MTAAERDVKPHHLQIHLFNLHTLTVSRWGFPPRAEQVGKLPLFESSRNKAVTLHSHKDNLDKVLSLLMWDCGCAMRTERPRSQPILAIGPAGLSKLRRMGCRRPVHPPYGVCDLEFGALMKRPGEWEIRVWQN